MSGLRGGRMLAVVVLLIPIASFAFHQSTPPRQTSATVGNPIGDLQKKIDSGAVKLAYDAQHGYLSSVLKLLKVPESSQTLVFSKSSFQLFLISPERPRALYFNDDVYVSWVRGGPMVEVSSVDPKEGPVFYTLSQVQNPHPRFVRQGPLQCLVCHDFGESATPEPRLLMLSVLPDPNGTAIGAASLITNDQSPFRERWGGWYVTGTHGAQRHLGNMVVHADASTKIDIKEYAAKTDLSAGANVTDLSSRFDTKPFLSGNSDIVALMVLGHQTHIHNLMTLAGIRVHEGTSASEAAEPLVKGMLFSGAVPLTDPVRGTSTFAAEFSSRDPHDSKGRSLYELDLKTRLLKYPLSYLVYSPTFDQLAPTIKQYVYRRFREVLSGEDKTPEFAHLSAADREAILGILKETKPDFAATLK